MTKNTASGNENKSEVQLLVSKRLVFNVKTNVANSVKINGLNILPRWQDIRIDNVAVTVSNKEREKAVKPFQDVQEQRPDGPLPEGGTVQNQKDIVWHV